MLIVLNSLFSLLVWSVYPELAGSSKPACQLECIICRYRQQRSGYEVASNVTSCMQWHYAGNTTIAERHIYADCIKFIVAEETFSSSASPHLVSGVLSCLLEQLYCFRWILQCGISKWRKLCLSSFTIQWIFTGYCMKFCWSLRMCCPCGLTKSFTQFVYSWLHLCCHQCVRCMVSLLTLNTMLNLISSLADLLDSTGYTGRLIKVLLNFTANTVYSISNNDETVTQATGLRSRLQDITVIICMHVLRSVYRIDVLHPGHCSNRFGQCCSLAFRLQTTVCKQKQIENGMLCTQSPLILPLAMAFRVNFHLKGEGRRGEWIMSWQQMFVWVASNRWK